MSSAQRSSLCSLSDPACGGRDFQLLAGSSGHGEGGEGSRSRKDCGPDQQRGRGLKAPTLETVCISSAQS